MQIAVKVLSKFYFLLIKPLQDNLVKERNTLKRKVCQHALAIYICKHIRIH